MERRHDEREARLGEPRAAAAIVGARERRAGGGVDGHDRANGTLQRSRNGGAAWDFLAHIGDAAMGYGYGDAHVLRDGTVALAFQRTFDPAVPNIEGGGYDIGLALVAVAEK